MTRKESQLYLSSHTVSSTHKYSVPKTSGIYKVKKEPGSCILHVYAWQKNKEPRRLPRVKPDHYTSKLGTPQVLLPCISSAKSLPDR